MLGMGKIVGPNEYGIYLWKTRGLEETQATIALLWRYLGPVKRSQASAAIRQVLDRYWSGQLTARRSRRARHHHMDHAVLIALEPGADVVERAWAAGFLDAEGCFGTYHSRSRKSAPDWLRIRVSATQHGQVGVPADVLIRLQRALEGLGRIERHGDPDDFRWLAEGPEAVDYVLARMGRWLGTVKSDQAQVALRRFRAQVRLRGDAMHCVRGHSYTRIAMSGGRLGVYAINAISSPSAGSAPAEGFRLGSSRTSPVATLSERSSSESSSGCGAAWQRA